MVDDDAVFLALPHGIGSVVHVFLLTAAEAHVADDVVAAGAYGEVTYRNTGVGCCLALDGGVVANHELPGQSDYATHIEHDDLFRRTAHGPTE